MPKSIAVESLRNLLRSNLRMYRRLGSGFLCGLGISFIGFASPCFATEWIAPTTLATSLIETVSERDDKSEETKSAGNAEQSRPPAFPIRLARPIQPRSTSATDEQSSLESSRLSGKEDSTTELNSDASDSMELNAAELFEPEDGLIKPEVLPRRLSEQAQPAEITPEGAAYQRFYDDEAEQEVMDDGPLAEVAVRAEMTPGMSRLLDSIDSTLKFYQRQHEHVERRSPWGIMHAMIAFEAETVVLTRGKPVNALGWLCWNGVCATNKLLYSQEGRLGVKEGPGLQGHEGQFLAMLAQCGVRPENELRVGNEQFTVLNVIEYEQLTCKPNTELTFKLLGLSYYLDSDATWLSADGRQWSIPELIREELKQPVIGAACGGTHRLMGLTYAVRYRKVDGKPVDGQWERAEDFLKEFRDYTYSLQNRDGSFSTNWFEGREAKPDIERRIQTTGHILEWLVVLADDEELNDPRLLRSVVYLNSVLAKNRKTEWEIGPKGHALHALVLYKRRIEALYAPEVATGGAVGESNGQADRR